MASFFGKFNLISLDLAEEYTKGSVGIYLIREKQDDMHIQDVLKLIRENLDNNRHLIV